MKRQESSIRKMVDASEKKVLKSLSDTSRLRSVVREECRDVIAASEKRVLEKVQESNDKTVMDEPICLTVPHTKRRRRGGVAALSQTTDTGTVPRDENAERVVSLIQKAGLAREKQNLFLVDDFF